MWFYVYVLMNEKQELYIGRTNDLRRRVKAHNQGKSQYTKQHHWRLVYFEAFRSSKDAYRREQKLKQHGQVKRWLKERIAESLKECAELSAGEALNLSPSKRRP